MLRSARCPTTKPNSRSASCARSWERLHDVHERLPSYNTDPGGAQTANQARRFHDFASAVLVVASNLVALAAYMHIYPTDLKSLPPPLWITGVVAVLCIAFLLWDSPPELRAGSGLRAASGL